VVCLVDTGCDRSLLPKRLCATEHLQTSSMRLFAANGSSIAVLGEVTASVRLGSTVILSRFIVSDNIIEPILGIDWLRTNADNWDFSSDRLGIAGRYWPLVSQSSTSACRRVVAVTDNNIPARSQVVLEGRIELPGFVPEPESDWMVESADKESGLCVARILVPRRLHQVPVMVCNVSNVAITVQAGDVISEVSAVRCLPDVADAADAVAAVNNITSAEAITASVQEEFPHLDGLLEDVDISIGTQHRNELSLLCRQYQDVFSKGELDLGVTPLAEHHIDTGCAVPIRQPLRRQPLDLLPKIDDHVQSMLAAGVIEACNGPWACNLVVVKKKDGSLRFCCDYRQLNGVTRKDAYPLPRIDACLDALSGAKLFSAFDLRSGYHQVPMAEEDADKTSFVVRSGTYRFRRVPFGLCNAGATFQRVMDLALRGLNFDMCLVYLDDIIVYSADVAEHLRRLDLLFQRLRSANLKLKPSKCQLLRTSVAFLGHVVSGQGVGTDPEKIVAVKDWPCPISLKEVQSFLGLAGYYRRFVPAYAERAAPLHRLAQKGASFLWTEGCQTAFDSLREALVGAPILAMPADGAGFILDTDASNDSIGAVLSQVQDGVERVIAYASRTLSRSERNYCVTRRELLAIVYFVKKFRMYLLGRHFLVRTDHAALQWLRRTPEPIGQQARWCEILEEFDFKIEHRAGRSHGNADALSRRPCRQCGATDPGGVTASTGSTSPSIDDVDKMGERVNGPMEGVDAVGVVSVVDDTSTGDTPDSIVKVNSISAETGVTMTDYTTGRVGIISSIVAILGAISCISVGIGNFDVIVCTFILGLLVGGVGCFFLSVTDNGGRESAIPDVSRRTIHTTVAADVRVVSFNQPDVDSEWSTARLAAATADDPQLGEFVRLLTSHQSRVEGDDITAADPVTKAFWADWERFTLRNGVLYRRWWRAAGLSDTWQLVPPIEYRQQLLGLIHSSHAGGHFGLKRTRAKLQAKAYWPGWAADVAEFINRCAPCAQSFRGTPPRRAPMQRMTVGALFERIAIDFTGPHPRSSSGKIYMLTAVDHFSKYAFAFPVQNREAVTVARTLISGIFNIFGVPKQLLSDRGPEFESALMRELCGLLGIDKLRTTSYKPSTNGAVERFHRTLNSLLAKVVDVHQRDWDEHVPFVLAAYRATPHSATGFSPNFLLFGHEVRAPIDLVLGDIAEEESPGNRTYGDFVADRRKTMLSAYSLTRETLGRCALRAKDRYDLRVRPAEYQVGEWVWFFCPRRYTGRTPKWQRLYSGPFLITELLGRVNLRIQRTRRSDSVVVHYDKVKPYRGDEPESWLTGSPVAEVACDFAILELGIGEDAKIISAPTTPTTPATPTTPTPPAQSSPPPVLPRPTRERKIPVRYR